MHLSMYPVYLCEISLLITASERLRTLSVSVQMFGGLGLASFVSQSSAFHYSSHNTPLFYWSDGWAGRVFVAFGSWVRHRR